MAKVIYGHFDRSAQLTLLNLTSKAMVLHSHTVKSVNLIYTADKYLSRLGHSSCLRS